MTHPNLDIFVRAEFPDRVRTIDHAAREAVNLALRLGAGVRFEWQGVTVDALPGMRPVEVARRWREGAMKGAIER